MRIQVDVSEAELADIRECTSQPDAAQAVRHAALEYVRYVRRMQLIELSGRIEMGDNWRDVDRAEFEDPVIDSP